MKAKKFLNYTDQDFSWKYDGIEYTFKAGESMFLEDYKADHFAKHLIDRELNKKNILTNNKVEREKLEKLCFPGEEVTPHEAMQIEEAKKEEILVEAKKRGRPKKVVEEEFADLKN